MKRNVAALLLGALLALSLYHFGRGLIESARHGFVDFPIFLDSAASFLDTGQLYLESDRLSTYAPSAPVYKFPPLFAMLLLPFARIDPPRVVYDSFWLLQVLIYLTALALALWRVPTTHRAALVGVGTIVALNFEPCFETLWRLQLELPILLLLTGCMACLVLRRDALAGALVGIAAMLKVYPAFLLLYFLVTRRYRALGWSLGAAVLVQAALWVVIGPTENYRFYLEVLPQLLREAPLASSENVGIARYAMTLLSLDGATAKRLGQLATLLLLAATLFAVTRKRHRPRSAADAALGFTLFVPVMLLASPNSWVNYQLLLLLPALVLLGRGAAPDERWRAWTWVLLPLSLLLFYAPCAAASTGWPCAQTPAFLGIRPLPRPFHDGMVALRGLTTLGIWAVACRALLRGTGQARPGAR